MVPKESARYAEKSRRRPGYLHHLLHWSLRSLRKIYFGYIIPSEIGCAGRAKLAARDCEPASSDRLWRVNHR